MDRRVRKERQGVAAVVAAAWGLFVGLSASLSGHNFVPSTACPSHRSVSVARQAVQELYLPDAGPKARQVLDVYNKLVGEKDEEAAAEHLNSLDPQQRVTLKQLIEAKNGIDNRPIETDQPEFGDTPERLHKKLQMVYEKGDEAVVAWNKKMDPKMAQAVQDLVEVEQSARADAEAQLEHDDEAAAQEVWELFKKQYPKPAETGRYMTTPVRENDIKYRFRRMKEAMEVPSETVLEMARRDCVPFVTDPNYIRRTWKAMLEACDSKEDALESLVLKHPGSLIAKGDVLKDQIAQAKLTASFVDATAGLGKMFR